MNNMVRIRPYAHDQRAEVLDTEPHNVDGTVVAGWVCTRLHPEDRMGEVYVLGMAMVMVETGDDPGHAPARASYEAAGFERWPVARYFKRLD